MSEAGPSAGLDELVEAYRKAASEHGRASMAGAGDVEEAADGA